MRRARRLLPALFALLAVVVLYALLFLPDSINKLKSDTLAALSYTSNWWLIISHQSYASEAGRPAAEAPLVTGDRRAVLPVLAPALGARVAQAGSPADDRHDVGRGARVERADGGPRQRQHQRRVLLTETRLSGLLLGSVMAFFFAPYQIRGKPGRGVRFALDIIGIVGHGRVAVVVRALHVPELHVG